MGEDRSLRLDGAASATPGRESEPGHSLEPPTKNRGLKSLLANLIRESNKKEMEGRRIAAPPSPPPLVM